MKKLLIVLLALVMALSLAACGKTDSEDSAKYEVTPDRLLEKETEEGVALADGQTQLEDFAEAEAVLGGTINWPENFALAYIVLDEDNTVSVEFTVDEIDCFGRYFPGEKENMSGLANMEFAGSKTLNVNGADMTLRYPTEATNYNAIGVAEGMGNNTSYMVVMQDGAVGGDKLAEITEAFVNALQF